MMEPDKSDAGFCLKGQDEAFASRQKSVFGSLPMVEFTHKEHPFLKGDSAPVCDTIDDDNIAMYKGEESMFKRPMPKLKRPSFKPRRQAYPNRRHERVPDYKVNPQKWVKHSLASTSEVTDRSNTAAALSFLRELEERKRKLDEPEEPHNPSAKIVFKKPKGKEEGKGQASKSYREGKLCMPAFEFGSNASKGKRTKSAVPAPSHQRTQQKTLSHLQEPEDDEDAADG